jgi:hypothetical protein
VEPDLAAELWREAGEGVEEFGVLERAELELPCQVLDLVLEVQVLGAESEEFFVLMDGCLVVGPKSS